MRRAEPALASRFDLQRLPADFYDDPYPTYAALRAEAPLNRLDDGSLFLTRYADVAAVYRDTGTFSSDKRDEFGAKFGVSPLYEHHTASLVFNDAPYHLRVRRLLVGALTPAAVEHLEAGIAALCDRLLDRLADRGAGDLIDDYAAAVPVEVIGNLLAVPPADRAPLRDWSLAILGALEPVVDPQAAARGNTAVAQFLDYLRTLVAERRRRPGDPRLDLLTRLITGDGTPLGEDVLLHNCIFLLNAGHETTTNLIGNAAELLCRFPDERRRLISDPSLLGAAVEETLRYESPNQLGNRCVVREARLDDIALPVGTRLTLGIGAANRDPAVFIDPDRFDVGRTPNRHLAFGGGAHQCAGLGLARLEGRIALARLLARFPRYELAGPALRSGRARFRGFTRLPVHLGPADARSVRCGPGAARPSLA